MVLISKEAPMVPESLPKRETPVDYSVGRFTMV